MRRTGRFSQQRKELWCGQYGALLFLWLTLIYSEWLVRSATISAAFWRAGLWLSVLFAFPPALAVFVLSAQFRKRGNRAVVLAFLGIVYLLYASAGVLQDLFPVLFCHLYGKCRPGGPIFEGCASRHWEKPGSAFLLLAVPLVVALVWGGRILGSRG